MMQRRDFIKSIGGAGIFAAIGVRAHAAPQGWREFEITYNVALKDPKLPARLWLPVPQDALDYQRVAISPGTRRLSATCFGRRHRARRSYRRCG